MWAPDIPPISPYTALRHFLVAAGGIVSAGLVIKFFLVPEPPVVRRQYPFDGLVKELGGVEENKVCKSMNAKSTCYLMSIRLGQGIGSRYR
jgi:NADH dehydrogenase (ubiquinone) 1 beta subcomplex subunit 8